MRIDFDNQQYRQFVDFAERATNRAVVKIGKEIAPADGEGGFAARGIVARSWDFIGNVGRFGASSAKNDAVRDLFKSTILRMFGVSDAAQLPEPLQDAMKLGDYGKGKPLSARRIKAVKAALDRLKEAQDYAANAVAGGGGSAEKVRGAFELLARKVQDATGGSVADIRNGAIIGQVNRSLCAECRKLAAGRLDTATFPMDIIRQLKVRLPDGRQLAKDFETARDQLAAFVADNSSATYEGLGGKDKAKVRILMSILNQRPGQGLLNSDGLALDPEGRSSQVFFGGKKGDDAVRYEYSVSFGEGGALNVKGNVVQEGINTILVNGDLGNDLTIVAGPGSKVEVGMELTIAPDELERLAGLDYSKYDDEGVKAKYDDPNVKNRYSDTSLLGKDFMFSPGKVTCTSTYKLTVND